MCLLCNLCFLVTISPGKFLCRKSGEVSNPQGTDAISHSATRLQRPVDAGIRCAPWCLFSCWIYKNDKLKLWRYLFDSRVQQWTASIRILGGSSVRTNLNTDQSRLQFDFDAPGCRASFIALRTTLFGYTNQRDDTLTPPRKPRIHKTRKHRLQMIPTDT